MGGSWEAFPVCRSGGNAVAYHGYQGVDLSWYMWHVDIMWWYIYYRCGNPPGRKEIFESYPMQKSVGKLLFKYCAWAEVLSFRVLYLANAVYSCFDGWIENKVPVSAATVKVARCVYFLFTLPSPHAVFCLQKVGHVPSLCPSLPSPFWLSSVACLVKEGTFLNPNKNLWTSYWLPVFYRVILLE